MGFKYWCNSYIEFASHKTVIKSVYVIIIKVENNCVLTSLFGVHSQYMTQFYGKNLYLY